MPSPLEGRRFWIAGIGGAGMSGYALLARAWGAEVRGWDRFETPYLEHLEGSQVEISDEPPVPPEGWEAVVSTAFAGRIPGKTRAELLAELVSLRDSIVVAGAHGKTTTSGMIAFCLERLGREPAWLIGGEIPQLGGNAGTGAGWLVVEGDESDRTISALRPRIAVVTNVDLDHHTTFGSRAEVEELFDEWLANVPEVVRGEDLSPYDGPLAVPGRAQPPERCDCSGGARARGGRRVRRLQPSSPSFAELRVASSGAGKRGTSRSSTTTRIIPRRSPRPSRHYVTAGACSCSSSRISTPARDISHASSQPRLRTRTSSP